MVGIGNYVHVGANATIVQEIEISDYSVIGAGSSIIRKVERGSYHSRKSWKGDKMKVAFGTVVYEQAWQCWCQFVDSINAQSESIFELLVINDGIELNKIEIFTKSLRLRCHIFTRRTEEIFHGLEYSF